MANSEVTEEKVCLSEKSSKEEATTSLMDTATSQTAPPPPKKKLPVVGTICTTLCIYSHQQPNMVASERLLSSAGSAVVKYMTAKNEDLTPLHGKFSY